MTQNAYQLISLDGTLVTSWPTSFDGGYWVVDINDVDVQTNGSIIVLPDASLVNNGQSIIFNNVSAIDFEVNTYTNVPLATIKAGEVQELYLYNNTTKQGAWRVVPYGGGANNINNVILESTNNSLVITNGNITPPGGTVDLQLTTSLANLNTINTQGILVIKGQNPLEWQTCEILGGDNIVVTDGDGILNNPIISLNNSLTNIANATIGSINITGTIIDSNNNNLTIDTGTGSLIISNDMSVGGDATVAGTLVVSGATTFDANVVIKDAMIGLIDVTGSVIDSNNNDLTIDTGTANLIISNDALIQGDATIAGKITVDGDATFGGNVTINGTFNNQFLPKVFCSFTDTLTPPTNSIVITSKSDNVSKVTGSSGIYDIYWTNPFSNINYTPTFGLNTDGGALPFVSSVYSTVRDVDHMTIAVLDAAGEPVTSAPYGVNVIIMSAS